VNEHEAKENSVSSEVAIPWYRQGWPWFLIALPATAVIGGIITAILAARGFDGPVVADYYKQGLAINEEVARAQLARELAISAAVEIAGFTDGDRVRVVLEAERALPPEAALRLRLAHPGRPLLVRSGEAGPHGSSASRRRSGAVAAGIAARPSACPKHPSSRRGAGDFVESTI